MVCQTAVLSECMFTAVMGTDNGFCASMGSQVHLQAVVLTEGFAAVVVRTDTAFALCSTGARGWAPRLACCRQGADVRGEWQGVQHGGVR